MSHGGRPRRDKGEKMRLGIYVGSFNPVHKGHQFIADYVVLKNYVDKVLMIPTESYWDKTGLIDLNHRLNMLKFCENENILVSDEYSSCEFTYEILEAIAEKSNDTELYLIIGADNLIKFELWENIDLILKHKVLVLGRNDINMGEQIKKFTAEQQNHFVLVKDFPEVDVSSTRVRNKLLSCNFSELNNELDENVLQYILKNKLYCKG